MEGACLTDYFVLRGWKPDEDGFVKEDPFRGEFTTERCSPRCRTDFFNKAVRQSSRRCGRERPRTHRRATPLFRPDGRNRAVGASGRRHRRAGHRSRRSRIRDPGRHDPGVSFAGVRSMTDSQDSNRTRERTKTNSRWWLYGQAFRPRPPLPFRMRSCPHA